MNSINCKEETPAMSNPQDILQSPSFGDERNVQSKRGSPTWQTSQGGSQYGGMHIVSGGSIIDQRQIATNNYFNDPDQRKRPLDLSASPTDVEDHSQRSRIKVESYLYTNETCQWLFQTQEYLDWDSVSGPTKANTPVLILQGKAGSGKSTLMHRALKHWEERRWNSNEKKPCILSFFFSVRDPTNKAQSVKGLYVNLVIQILRQTRDSHDSRAVGEKLTSKDIYDWDNETLAAAIYDLVVTVTDRQVVLFLDALDECRLIEPNRQTSCNQAVLEVVLFLEKLLRASSHGIRLCLSSRDLSPFHKRLSPISKLDVSAHNDEDIKHFLKCELNKTDVGDSLRKKLLRIISARASNVFLWARLAVEKVSLQSIQNGLLEENILAEIENLPSELHKVFDKVLSDIAARENYGLSITLLQLIYAAVRPLTLAEVRSALTQVDDALKSEEIQVFMRQTDEDFEKVLHRISGGLIESWNDAGSRWDRKPPSLVLRFIHTSVRDFIRKGGLSILDPKLENRVDAHCHLRVAKLCIKLLEGPKAASIVDLVRPSQVREDPFLRYASILWTLHVRKGNEVANYEDFGAESSMIACSDQSQLICKLFRESKHIVTYANKTDIPMQHLLQIEYCSGSMFVLLAFEGCEKLLAQHARRCIKRKSCYQNQHIIRAAFFLSVRRGWVATASLLWGIAEEQNIKIDLDVFRGESPLLLACAFNQPGMVELLLKLGADPFSKESGSPCIPFHVALRHGSLDVLNFLLSPSNIHEKAFLEAKSINGRTVLHAVGDQGHLKMCEKIIKQLLYHQIGDIILLPDKQGKSAIEVAEEKFKTMSHNGGGALSYSPKRLEDLQEVIYGLRNLASMFK